MTQPYNGMPAPELTDVTWQKSKHSNPNGACVEVAHLPNGEIAVRNSRFPAGPALVYTRAEIAAFLAVLRRRVRPRDLILRGTTSLPGRTPVDINGHHKTGVRITHRGNEQALVRGVKRTCLPCNCHRFLFRNGMITWEDTHLMYVLMS